MVEIAVVREFRITDVVLVRKEAPSNMEGVIFYISTGCQI